ncbi:MAG: hypothetical protein KDC38_19505 [Planctomycetes bacterium]|nr:hypothetical protein [Planctomycetota bacterium]
MDTRERIGRSGTPDTDEDASPRGGLDELRASARRITNAVSAQVRAVMSENSEEYLRQARQTGGQ